MFAFGESIWSKMKGGGFAPWTTGAGMDWRDQGILLSVRRHGESSAIAEVFTQAHGRHAGVVRGGAGRRLAPVLQPGAQLEVQWRARLEEHLGTYQVEPIRSRAAIAMADRLSLAGLGAVVALLGFCLPERQAHPGLYERSERLLDLLDQPDLWPLAYLQWERVLLEEMGYGLDLEYCAVTGRADGLIYVSPQSGRAVTAEGAGAWAPRMLPLPPCLKGEGPAPDTEIADGLRTTGFFLSERLAPDLGNKPLPDARARFVTAFSRRL